MVGRVAVVMGPKLIKVTKTGKYFHYFSLFPDKPGLIREAVSKALFI